MMLTPGNISTLSSLVRSPQWPALIAASEEYMRGLLTTQVSGNTEWEYIKASLSRDMRAEGIKMFFDYIEKLILNHDKPRSSAFQKENV